MAMKHLWYKHLEDLQALGKVDVKTWYRARDKSLAKIFAKCPYKIPYLFSIDDVPGAPGSEEEKWCEDNFEGKFCLGVECLIGKTKMYSVCCELESDLTAFKMVWSARCL